MYAVIETGGKQYRVAEGETLRVEKLPASKGDKLTFETLLFADDGGGIQVGKPRVPGVKVEAEVIEQAIAEDAEGAVALAPGDKRPGYGKKIILFKYKRRKSYRRKGGHRQPYTALKITSITAGA